MNNLSTMMVLLAGCGPLVNSLWVVGVQVCGGFGA